MFFQSMVKVLNSTYDNFNFNKSNSVSPELIKYFRTEYGKNWKVAMEHHIYKESLKNDKKAA
jgi:hypothetical protein|tara:strand:+ start:268 stop:453 length:186 start_codon:yes stop_codon:yes gene_type:complete